MRLVGKLDAALLGLALFGVVLTSTFSSAQTGQGRITGYVHDEKDAAVVGAKVVIVSTLTGEKHETVTTDTGTFAFPLLLPSTYEVTATAEGFRPEKHTGIQLTAEALINVDLALHVGQVSQSVDVKADAELITAQGAAIGETIGEEAITELPLNGRNPASLINITPGAVDTINTSNAGFNETFVSFPSSTASSVGGQRQGNVYYTLDGANAMDSWGGLATPMPNPDATQEFKVTSNNPDAESGFSAGGTVSIVTKSGTNQWHGDVFEFLRNGQFNSKGWFETAADELHRNQFGGSIGGPIKKDKLFVFLNYQGTVNHQTVNGGSTVVPNSMAIAGNFQFLCTSGTFTNGICDDRSVSSSAPANTVCPTGIAPSANCLIADQLYVDQAAVQANNGTNAYLNNMIDPTTYGPVALNLEKQFPQTSDPAGRVSTAGTLNVFNYQEGTAKTDYIINSSNRLSYRAFIDNYNQPPTGSNIIFATRSWPVQFQSHTATWTWTVRPNLLNNFVFGYGRLNSDSTSGYTKDDNLTALGATGVATDASFPSSLGLVLDNWANCLCENFNGFNRHTINLTDSVTYTRGKHLITAGVDILYQNQYGGTDWGAVPIVNIDGSQTGNWMSDFLLGHPQSFQQSGGGFLQEYQKNMSAYGTDTIRLRPNLTVNAGVRWEPFFARTSANNKEGFWDPGQQSTRFPNAPLGEVYPGDAGVPAGTIPNRYDIFSPRVGIAWQPRFMPHMSIRAGFGMFSAPADGTLDPGSIDQPFTPNVTVTANTLSQGVDIINLVNPWATFTPTGGQSPFPPFATPSYIPPKDATFQPLAFYGSFAPNYTSGKNESWNLSVERQFGQTMVAKVAYVGSHAYHLPIIGDQNAGQFSCFADPPTPQCTTAMQSVNGVRPIPYVQELAISEAAAVSSYDGLLLSFDKKFSRGLLFSVNYAWSKTLDELSASHFDGNGSFSDPYDIRHDYGISDLNFPRIFNMYWVYVSPGLKSMNPVARGFLATWQLSGIWHMQSGRPFSIGSPGDNSFSLEGEDRADVVAGQKTSSGVQRGKIDSSGYIPYLTNPNAFVPNAIGTFGDSGRNILAGPGINNWDLAASKNFQITERYRLQIRADAFNAFNRTQFGVPDTNVLDKSVGFLGVLYSIQNAPRVMQFSGKFYF